MSKITTKEYLDMQVKFISARLTDISLGSASSDNDVARMAQVQEIAEKALRDNP